MVKIILIKKNGDIQEKNVKSLEDDTLLYKKCGFQTAKDFGLQHMYKGPRQYKQFDYAVYAKTSGKGGLENKYELPPPIDKNLYFNTLCIIKLNVDKNGVTKILDLTEEEWNKVYEKLFGGFENLGDTSSDEEEDELDDVPSEMLTKKGYLKDDFIVDSSSEDEDEDEEDYDSELEEEEYTDDEDED